MTSGKPKKTRNTLKTGTVVNEKWVILELVGKGGMGEVYHAHQINLKRDVALKIVSESWFREISDDAYETIACMERFRREVEVMARTRHPNVLQIYDYGTLEPAGEKNGTSLQYMVMEYIPGATLRTTMSEQGFHPEEQLIRNWLKQYFLPVLQGVQTLHDLGIVHRDLKPENILLDGNTPKIADFGISQSCRSKPVTQSLDVKGTPPYMSPEHFMDFRRTDLRTDIYSLGKILYEAVEGKMGPGYLPFKTARLKDPQTAFFVELDRIIRLCTHEDREARLQNVAELQRQLESLLGEPGPGGILQKHTFFAKKPESVRKLVSAGLLLMAAMVLSLGVYMVMPGSERNHPPQSMPEIFDHKPWPPEAVSEQAHIEMHPIPGGKLVIPEGFAGESGKTVTVEPFYLDETPVTNYQYVEFLNIVISRIEVEDDAVIGYDDRIWLLLGVAMKDYEPIVYRNGGFQVSHGSHAACPVIWVTGYGAWAYARFYGKRLMTDHEWLYALLHGKKGRARAIRSTPPVTTPVIMFEPDAFGVRGLNEGIGEWAVTSVTGDREAVRHMVLGGSREQGGMDYVFSAVERMPRYAFKKVGFRCAQDARAPGGDEGK